jgi:hypothetical protein
MHLLIREMEGRHALRISPPFKRLPLLCGSMFVFGGIMEYIMCKTGFYTVYTVKGGKREAEEMQKDEDFWLRVRSRRGARQTAGLIKDD